LVPPDARAEQRDLLADSRRVARVRVPPVFTRTRGGFGVLHLGDDAQAEKGFRLARSMLASAPYARGLITQRLLLSETQQRD